MNDETPDSPPNRTELQIGVPTITRESIQGLPTIPGYQVLRELGRGGMGVVYEAKHLSLGRTVAIKLMKRDDGLHQARFLAEGQIIAAVKHPNVVEVHDFGECSVGPFIAMEFLTGGSFSQKLKGGTALPPREAAEIIAKIAAGVGAAHDISIVHRDLKPGNVLLDANGNPKVTDFGLAKRTDFDLTLTHEAAGTPSYMAPEQARAMKFVGPPADVWSLGVMLYESLTGRKPFVAETDAELLITIQNAEPPTLRTLTKSIPHDLETICLKCLEKEPERRYATAKELAADLTAWIEGKPIAARRATEIEKVMLWVRRKPAIAGLAAALILSLAIGSGVSAGLAIWAFRKADQATDAFKLADKRRQAAEKAEAETKAEKERADKEAEIALELNEFYSVDLLRQADVRWQITSDKDDRAAGAGPSGQVKRLGPGEADRNLTVRQALDRAEARVGRKFGNRPLVEATIRLAIGETYRGIGESTKAVDNLQRAVKLRTQHLSENHPDIAKAYTSLGFCLDTLGRYAEGELLHRKALKSLQEAKGPLHPEMVETNLSLGWNLHQTGRYAEAEQYYRKAMSIRLQTVGDIHPDTATAMSGLALNLGAQARHSEAATLFRKAMDIFRQSYGDDHPDTARSFENLAYILNAKGNAAEAGPLYQKALDAIRKLHGEDHPDTARSYSNLASNLNTQGKVVEAGPLFRKALDINRKLLGEDHPTTTTSYSNIALNFSAQGKAFEAGPIFQKTLDSNRRVFGDNHPATATSYSNFASCLDALGKVAEAESFFRKALEINLAVLGEGHTSTATSYIGVATNMSAQGKSIASVPLYRKALEIYRKVLGDEHPTTAEAYFILAANISAQGHWEEAKNLLEAGSRCYEAARLNVDSGVNRGIATGKFSPYRLLAIAHARNGNAVEAWNAFESDLARGYLDELAIRQGQELTPADREKRDQLRTQLEAIEKRIYQLVTTLELSDFAKAELNSALQEETSLRRSMAELAIGVSRRMVASLQQIQTLLAVDQALVSWVDVSDPASGLEEHWACVVRSSGIPTWTRLEGSGPRGLWTKDDGTLPLRFITSLYSSKDDTTAIGNALIAQRIAPIAKLLSGVRTLTLVTVGPMAGVPVEVLTEMRNVGYVLSGSSLSHIRQKRKPQGPPTLLAIGDPNMNTGPSTAKAPPSPVKTLPSGGLLIVQVVPGGAAANANLQVGDVILKYNDVELLSHEKLNSAIALGVLLFDKVKPPSVTIWREATEKPFERVVAPGRLGVQLDKSSAPVAIANRRIIDQQLETNSRISELPRLPGTSIEIGRLGQLFGDRSLMLTRSEASEQRLDELRSSGRLKAFHYVHIATHGLGNNVQAFETSLILSQDQMPIDKLPMPGKPYINGQLTAREVLDYWNLDAELVTLSACETAVGMSAGGDGIVGFSQAFQIAGSRSVCASLFKVDDTATVLLMRRFYENLLGKREGLVKPMSKAAALGEAKSWLRNMTTEEANRFSSAIHNGVARGKAEKLVLLPGVPKPKGEPDRYPYSHPKYWAAFVLIGDPD